MNELLHDTVSIDQTWTRGGVVSRFLKQMKHRSIQQLATANMKNKLKTNLVLHLLEVTRMFLRTVRK
jgi:hypothetical protein